MMTSTRHSLVWLAMLCLTGCSTEPPKPTIDECFSQLKRGMTQDEIVALMGKPRQRTDGPQVAVSDRDMARGQSFIVGNRVIMGSDPVTLEMIRFFIQGGQKLDEPPSFASGPAVETKPDAEVVNWLYRPSQGRGKNIQVQDKSLIWMSFREGKLVDTYRLSLAGK